MRRSWWFLIAVLATAVLFDPAVPAPVPSPPATSVRLSAQEADCIVGGQVGCLGEAVGGYIKCVENNYDPERPETGAAFVGCGAVGLWTGAVCAMNWLWRWLFG